MRSGSCEPEVRRCRGGEGGSAGTPPCFLFSIFLFFSLFLQGDIWTTGFPPSKFFFLFVFSKISFFGDEDKDQAGYDFLSHLNFLAFFVFSPHIFIFLGRRATWNAFRPSWAALFFLSYITYFSTWGSHYGAIYYVLFDTAKGNSGKFHAKKDKVYLLIVCCSFAPTKNPCNPPFEFWKLSSTWPEEWGPPLCIHCIALHWSKKLCIIIKVLHFNWS